MYGVELPLQSIAVSMTELPTTITSPLLALMMMRGSLLRMLAGGAGMSLTTTHIVVAYIADWCVPHSLRVHIFS